MFEFLKYISLWHNRNANNLNKEVANAAALFNLSYHSLQKIRKMALCTVHTASIQPTAHIEVVKF